LLDIKRYSRCFYADRMSIIFNELGLQQQSVRAHLVTLTGANHDITQEYCSALPVSYSNHGAAHWDALGRLVLEASNEATLCLATLKALETKDKQVFLTMLGGGAFGNRREWIVDAILRSLRSFRDFDLNLGIVSYGWSSEVVGNCIDRSKG
jgi:hypothetical protein